MHSKLENVKSSLISFYKLHTILYSGYLLDLNTYTPGESNLKVNNVELVAMSACLSFKSLKGPESKSGFVLYKLFSSYSG